MKKICVLLITVLLMTGCSARYDLKFINNTFEESLEVYSNDNENINGESFKTLTQNYYDNTYYLVNYNDQPGDLNREEILAKYPVYNKELTNLGIKLSYEHKNNDYKNSAIVHNLFDNLEVTNTSIRAYKIKNVFNNYENLEDLTISFYTDREVYSTNCDEEKEGVYYWYINKNNYESKTINIDMSKNNKSVIEEIDISDYSSIILIIVGVILVILMVGVYVKVRNSNKK